MIQKLLVLVIGFFTIENFIFYTTLTNLRSTNRTRGANLTYFVENQIIDEINNIKQINQKVNNSMAVVLRGKMEVAETRMFKKSF